MCLVEVKKWADEKSGEPILFLKKETNFVFLTSYDFKQGVAKEPQKNGTNV